MTLNKLASLIAKREGKRSQVAIGNIREVLKIICTLDAEYLLAGDDINGPLATLARQADKIHAKIARQPRARK